MLNSNRLKKIFNNKKFPIKISDIKKLKQIHDGYTNISYFLHLNNNKKYHVRIGNNTVTNRVNEYAFIKAYKQERLYKFFNIRNGDYIRSWIDHPTPTSKEVKTSKFIKALTTEIDRLHKINPPKSFIKHNYFEFISKTKLPNKYKKIYIHLLKKYDTDKWVLSHNDLSLDNLIFYKNKVIFIDYEWARLNNPYWDIANFIRESSVGKDIALLYAKHMKSIKNFNLKTFQAFLYISNCYAWQWAYFMKPTKKIIKYRALCIKRLANAYDNVINLAI